MSESIGDRMKNNYEDISRHFLVRRMPAIIRLDGRAFHTFTRNITKPFSEELICAMVLAAQDVADDMQGFKLAYIQSDEVSFVLTDYDTLQTDAWFGYNIQKMVSIAASRMSVNFNFYYRNKHHPVFDGRAFNIPKEEVSNYFLWRALDWQRNSVQMYSQSFFSHSQLMNKNQTDMHEMLHGIGKNWATDLSDQIKNGTFIRCPKEKLYTVKPNYSEISQLVEPLLEPVRAK
jgi:tRNA(His) 5'-end guanylyltransferase